jgi:TetR/AcrR family transcriptional regulator, regulator of mycofactocin system
VPNQATAGKAAPGRPRTTSRHEVQHVALGLFAEQGFEATTLDEVAAALGVSRRTLFRYYPSKNDIVWGEFSEHLAGLRERLGRASPDEPLMDVVRRAVVAFNDYGVDELPELRIRMGLITSVPALQGHSMLRYRDWCEVIAEFVAARLGCGVEDHLPQVIANAALGTAMATYRHWITHPQVDLLRELDEAFRLLAGGFDERLLRGRS